MLLQTPDMTSPATSGGHLSKFEKNWPKMSPPMVFVRILVVRRFAWPNHLVGVLLLIASERERREREMLFYGTSPSAKGHWRQDALD